MSKFIPLLCVILAIMFLDVSLLNEEESLEIHIQSSICPKDGCAKVFTTSIMSAKESLFCAIYDIDEEYLYVFDTLIDIEKWIVVERKMVDSFRDYMSYDTNSAYMHNKFCVIDKKKVITGSTNPTKNGFGKNDNMLVVIESEEVAKTYLQKFEEIKAGKKRNQTTNNEYGNNLEAYFCPEDNCAAHLIEYIKKANTSIFFATFSFTDMRIATELILAKKRGINISGIIETRMATNSVYSYLLQNNVSIKKDTNPATMHLKLFVFDDSITWTGSYNPTGNGNTRNDENVIVIKK